MSVGQQSVFTVESNFFSSCAVMFFTVFCKQSPLVAVLVFIYLFEVYFSYYVPEVKTAPRCVPFHIGAQTHGCFWYVTKASGCHHFEDLCHAFFSQYFVHIWFCDAF